MMATPFVLFTIAYYGLPKSFRQNDCMEARKAFGQDTRTDLLDDSFVHAVITNNALPHNKVSHPTPNTQSQPVRVPSYILAVHQRPTTENPLFYITTTLAGIFTNTPTMSKATKSTKKVTLDDNVSVASSSTMEAAENNDIEMLGRSYKIGDTLESRRYGEMTKSLHKALADMDVDGDGVIDESEVFHAAKTLVQKKQQVNVLQKALGAMIVAIMLVAASTFAVSLWANKLSKDIYAAGDVLTNSHGEILKTSEKMIYDQDLFALVDAPFEGFSSTVRLEFKIEQTEVSFRPSVITRKITEMGPVITYKSNGGDRVVVTRDSLTYMALGEEEEPLVLTKEDSQRRLRDDSFTTMVRPPNV